MRILARLVSCGLLVLGLSSFGSAAFAAAEIKTQPPCIPDQCAFFESTTPTIPVIRSFTYDAPSKGTANVSFHGSMVCINFQNPQIGFFRFFSQIVTGAGVLADGNGPGGLRLQAYLAPQSVGYGFIETFNLASSRVFEIPAAGSHTYFFKLRKFEMTGGRCFVQSAAFTVNFVPKP